MKTLSLGTMVHFVTIQSATDGVDDAGAPVRTWATLAQAWMSRRTDRTGEAFRADQMSASSVIAWQMRYLASMDPDSVDVPQSRRLLYQGRAYDIVGAETIDRQVGIELRTLSRSAVSA